MKKQPKEPTSTAVTAPAVKPWAIGTAARLAGVPSETVRIWERRYGLLDPARSAGGHRLYDERDVEILRAVKTLVDAGMRVGTVAALPIDRLLAEAAHAAPATVTSSNEGWVADAVAAGLALDGGRLAALLDRPRLLTDAVDVVGSLYLPLLARIGELWERGAYPVAAEHFVEKHITARLHALLQSTPTPTDRLALCACAPDDRHEAGLLAAALVLKTVGYAVAVLGDVPTEDLVRATRTLQPALVLIAATNRLSRAARTGLPAALDRAPLLDVDLILGGANADALATLLKRKPIVVRSIGALAGAARALTG